MRGFVGWLLLLVLLGAAAFVAAPFVARPIVAGVVRAALPIGSGAIDVDASVETLGLLRGSIDQVRVTGNDLEAGGATISSLDATARDVSIGDHSFGSMTGSLEGVVLQRADGLVLTIDGISLSGPSSAVRMEASLASGTVVDLAEAALADGGFSVDRIELIDGGLRLTVLGRRTDVVVGVVDGVVTVAGPPGGSISVFGPESGDAWRITGVSVTPSGMDVQAILDLDQVLRAR